MMKITQVAGFLGCGKTTLMLKLSRELANDGERKVALLVNEIGEIPVDGKIMPTIPHVDCHELPGFVGSKYASQMSSVWADGQVMPD